jgi:8-hydroxy-5-deazaflavin:NADPH oxidoreductase
MTTLGLIGAGHIGSTLARLATAAGIDVVVANSRGPETLQSLMAELGEQARAAYAAEAASAGDLVVVSIPLRSITNLPKAELAGKIVIDTGNYYPQRDGVIDEVENGQTTTSELLAREIPRAHVVKAFNNIFWGHLGALPRPAGADDRSALPIAGDDEEAKQQVAALLDRLGYDAVDAGPLREGWRFERDNPAYGEPYHNGRGLWAVDTAQPADAERIRARLSEAVPPGQRGAR